MIILELSQFQFLFVWEIVELYVFFKKVIYFIGFLGYKLVIYNKVCLDFNYQDFIQYYIFIELKRFFEREYFRGF